VLAFLAAWSSKLHALGYLSGVYSSTGSGIADLVGVVGTSFPEPDEIWIADWNGQPTTGDAAVPAADWVAHQRIHQYEGAHNETYGGATINVDSDAVDTATAQPGYTALFPDGTFVQVSGTQQVYRIAGGAPLPLVDWSTVGGPQAVVTITEQQLQMLPPVPANGTFLGTAAGAYYRVAGGAPLILTNWSLFGGVRPFVTIDPWDIENLSNPAAHLLAQPIDGTVVQGLPSHGYWWFSRGRRVPARPSRRAVRVDDAGLARFPIVTCVVPRLRHLTFPSAKRALRSAYCRLGKVRRPRHWPRTHRLRVVWQVPQPGIVRRAWWRVGLGLR
jgi:hypothetical protein